MASVNTRHQAASRRSTYRVPSVVVRKSQPFSGHLVQAGRFDPFLSVTTQVAIPQIIDHDVDQIGLLGCQSSRSKGQHESNNEKSGKTMHGKTSWETCVLTNGLNSLLLIPSAAFGKLPRQLTRATTRHEGLHPAHVSSRLVLREIPPREASGRSRYRFLNTLEGLNDENTCPLPNDRVPLCCQPPVSPILMAPRRPNRTSSSSSATTSATVTSAATTRSARFPHPASTDWPPAECDSPMPTPHLPSAHRLGTAFLPDATTGDRDCNQVFSGECRRVSSSLGG